jgi:NitT/TauT family transport system permease protein
MALAIVRKTGKLAYSLLSVVLFLLLWEVVARLEMVNPIFLPPFTRVAAALWGLISSGVLVKHIFVSLQRSLLGFGLGLAFAIPLGLVIGWYKGFERFIDPLIQTFRNLSVLALLPVFVLLFGIGETSKVAVVFWGVLWSVLLNTISGVKSTDLHLIKAARSMGISNLLLFVRVILPGALPSILTGVRISATSSILVLIAAEMLGANQGLGYALYFYQANIKTPEMFAIIVVLALLGLAVNYSLAAFEKRTFRYREELPENGRL